MKIRVVALCDSCDCEVSPHSGLIVRGGIHSAERHPDGTYGGLLGSADENAMFAYCVACFLRGLDSVPGLRAAFEDCARKREGT